MIPPPPVKTGKKSEDKKQAAPSKAPQRRHSQGTMQTAQTESTGEAAQAAAPRRKYSLIHNMKFSEMSEKESPASLNPEAPVFTMRQRRLSRPSVPSSPHPASFLIEPAFGMMHPLQPFSWMTRRFRGPADYLAVQQSVIRQPRGPAAEKGRGFQKWCKHRMEPSAERKPGSRAVPIVAPPSSIQEEPEIEEGAAAAAAAPPKIEVQPLIVNVLEESSSEDDEGNFSDQDRVLESEKAR